MSPPTDRFVHEQNLRLLREVLARTTDEVERRRIVKLIEQEQKNKSRTFVT